MKTAKKYPIKKKEIVETAEKLFLKKGYQETTVDDILEAASLSKGGFYHYFASKEEVLSESINTLMTDMFNELEPIVQDESLGALEKLKRFMKKKTEFKQPRKEFARYLSMLMKSDFTLYKYYLSLTKNYVDLFSQIIEQGAQEGVFTVQYPYETADILLRAVTSFPQSIYLNEYVSDEMKRQRYSISMRDVIAKTLGIDVKELTDE